MAIELVLNKLSAPSGQDTDDGLKGEKIAEFLRNVRDKAIKDESFKQARERGSEEEQKRILRQIIHIEAEENFSRIRLTSQDKSLLLDRLYQTMFGFGVLQPFMEDEAITEIMVNGINNVFIEKNGRITQACERNGMCVRFADNEELYNIIQRIVAPVNRRVDESEPIVDARLPDGSRVNVVLNPVSIGGAAVTIRKFPENPFSMEQLVGFGTITREVALFMDNLVKARYNIIISGGTSSGKTTFLNALSRFINPCERIITIEDSAELKVTGIKNLVRLEARPANIEGKGCITIRELVRTSLRMRPDRIIVGEVRGGEALDMLQAMNTGHDGSLSTIHANSAEDALSRLETMALTSGVELPLAAVRRQISSAVDFIIHVGKIMDGTRKVLQLCEVSDVKDGEVSLNEIYRFKQDENQSGDYVNGMLEYTGNRMKNIKKLQLSGIKLLDFYSG